MGGGFGKRAGADPARLPWTAHQAHAHDGLLSSAMNAVFAGLSCRNNAA